MNARLGDRARRGRAIAALAVGGIVLAACSSDPTPGAASDSEPTPSTSTPDSDPPSSAAATSPSPTGSSPTSPAPTSPAPTSPAQSKGGSGQSVDDLTLAQQVGQLFMTGTDAGAVETATVRSIQQHHVGNVMLRGRSDAGVSATADVVRELTGAVDTRSTGGVDLLIATDQEGGLVQVLSGPGFSEIPPATEQAQRPPAALRRDARGWARELVDAGVDINLAPVLDVVPAGTEAGNAPIGAFGRQYGSTPAAVSSHGLAYLRGMADAGVLTTPKHFPGLGAVRGNTDTAEAVHDRRTTADDATLRPFRIAVRDGAPLMMMSTAVYDRIDPHAPAAFSRRIVTGLLRGELGFDGVVISDDLSAAAQVGRWTPAQRAVRFVRAGGDLVLAIDPDQMDTMTGAVLGKARTDPAFRAQVRRSAARVLALKSQAP